MNIFIRLIRQSFVIKYLNHFLILSILVIASCTPQAQKSLLSNPQVCTDITCTQTAATDIVGDLSIDPELSSTTMNIEKGDLIEINGLCKDLGRKNNRIIVNVFHVDDDESILPYIDNSMSPNCQVNSVGLLTTQQCFFVTHGNGLTETGQTYPQCINGRFSFKVRLGSVSKVGAVVKGYLVRMKIRTLNPSAESGWARTTVLRAISAPPFSLSVDANLNQCIVQVEPYKFKDVANALENIPNITYAIKRQESGFTATGTPNPAVIPAIPADRLGGTGFFPFDVSQIDLGDSIANFFDGKTSPYVVLTPTIALSLQPGISYNYSTQARANLDDSVISPVKTCNLPAPGLNSFTMTGAICQIPITSGAVAAFLYEWQYSTIKGWTSSNGNGQGFIPCSTNPGVQCNFDLSAPAFNSGGYYYAAVRTTNGAGLYGKWSVEVPCRKP